MENYRDIFNMSYKRAVSSDSKLFFKRFYENFFNADPRIPPLFSDTDMDMQIKVLMLSMTHVISFAKSMEADGEIYRLAKAHGKDHMDLPAEMFDIWLDCLVDTVIDYDPEFNYKVETAWRMIMSPGIEYMKSYCGK